jgi:hypothetical protein
MEMEAMVVEMAMEMVVVAVDGNGDGGCDG